MNAGRPNRRGRFKVLMVGTSMKTMGGISTVVKGYVDAGLFDRMSIRYVMTHSDGSGLWKLKAAIFGYVAFTLALARRDVGLVHIHLSSRASFWRKLPIFMLAKLARKPVLLHLHGSEFMTFYDEECGPLAKRLITAVFNSADRILVLSPQWASNVKRFTGNRNIEVLFNGVPVPKQVPDRSHNSGSPKLLFLGRLGWRKGIYDLLDALKKVAAARVDFKLIAAGDGEMIEVAARAQELGLSAKIEVPGWIGDKDKAAHLGQADIFVLPSHAEGLPMGLLEAMAAGLPVVCTSVGGMPTAVSDEVEGIIVSPGNVDALSIAVQRLLVDSELRLRMGRNAFERAKRDFDVRHSVDRLVSIYERYIGE